MLEFVFLIAIMEFFVYTIAWLIIFVPLIKKTSVFLFLGPCRA